MSSLMLLRASELFAEDDGRVHSVHCLRGEDAAFCVGEWQVDGRVGLGGRYGGGEV